MEIRLVGTGGGRTGTGTGSGTGTGTGTGGAGGWPQPGCRCASCARARSAGRRRAPAEVVVDGTLRLRPGEPPRRVSSESPGGHRVQQVPGAWAVTGPDGARLLVADGSGRALAPPDSSGPYDVALLDLLEDPAQLGALRRRGLVGPATAIAVFCADHRISAEEELARRCRFWGVATPGDGDVITASPGGAARAGGPGQPGGAGGSGQPGEAEDQAQPRRVLVLGGARSGKSRHAELRLAAEPAVTYLAAGPYPAGAQPADDSEWAERVAAHRSRRPPWWRTVESVDAPGVLREESGVVLFDGAGTWLAAMMDESATSRSIATKVDELIEAWRQTRARVVAVSDEVGASVHPESRAGRMFRDQLGWLNQRLAAESEEAVLMVAGRAIVLPG
jgi:adenosylcobinamide kinase/adenosylcobinamide-phosphate guanylyltransferase